MAIVAVLCFALGMPSAGADVSALRDGEVSMAGTGASLLCTQWLADRREMMGGPDMAAWVLGFLSGAAISRDAQQDRAGRDPLRGVRAEDALSWIDSWCQARPSHPLYAAASAFVNHFPAGRR